MSGFLYYINTATGAAQQCNSAVSSIGRTCCAQCTYSSSSTPPIHCTLTTDTSYFVSTSTHLCYSCNDVSNGGLADCLTCSISSGTNTCLTCTDSYHFLKSGKCYSCLDTTNGGQDGCLQCTYSGSFFNCTQVVSNNYYIDQYYAARACNGVGGGNGTACCLTCTFSIYQTPYFKCLNTTDSYYFINSNNYSCEPCSVAIPDCLTCSLDGSTCLTCSDSGSLTMYLTAADTCLPCSDFTSSNTLGEDGCYTCVKTTASTLNCTSVTNSLYFLDPSSAGSSTLN